MKTRIDELLRGEFEYAVPELLFSEEKVYVSVSPGGTFQGEVYLGAEDGRKIRGYIVSSSRRLVPGFTEFSGTTVRLPFGVDGVGMEGGEETKEWLCFTTNIGEYRLPFVIETKQEASGTVSAEVRTPEELASLASENFREACRAFTSPAFRAALQKKGGRELSVYKGLTVPPVTHQSLEEFLVALKLKDKVSVKLSDYRREVYGIRESTSDALRITRSGWGCLRLEADAEGDFITLEKHVITDEDFIGSACTLNYVIRADKIGNGRHFGRIRIRTPYDTLYFEVEASRKSSASFGNGGGTIDFRMTERKRRLDLCRDYIDYKTGRSDMSAWIVSGHYELNRLRESGCDYPEYLLFEAFMFLAEGKKEEASRVLVTFRDRSYAREDIETAGIYLYLCVRAGLFKDTESAIRKIRSFCRQKEDSLWLHLALISFDPEYRNSPERALNVLEDLFSRGLRSPFMYLAALIRIREDESLLRHLNRFWIQVFLFGAKQKYLTSELAMRFSYLSGYEKQFTECLYRALSLAYETWPSDDSLEAVCRYIMMENPRRKEYFRWYSLAVRKGMRLTRLYEYYMETLDTSSRIQLPRPVLMYFNYNNNSMGENRKAWLYAAVTENRAADPESYESYRGTMAAFAKERLLERKINEDLAVLYKHFIPVPEDQDEAEAMADICFCRRVYCDAKEIRSVAVVHRQLKNEAVYQVSRGVSYPKIYTEDAAVIFVDSRQRRFASTIEHSTLPLMEENSLSTSIMDRGVTDPGLLLSFCESHKIQVGNLSRFMAVAESDAFTPEYRDEIRRRILDFYRRDRRGESLNLRMKQFDCREYAMADRKSLLEVLTIRGLFEEAYHVIEEFGTEGMDPSSLLRITSRMILKYEMRQDDELVALASEVYRSGTYDETVLEYLMEHRYGPVDELIRILKSARGFEMDTYSFEEKILCLLMLTHDYRKEGETILEHYGNSAGKERIIGAYLTQASYGYLVKDFNISAYERKMLEKAVYRKWPVDRICRYALFKAIVREKDPKGRYDTLKKDLLEECQAKDLCFSFFRRLPVSMRSRCQLDDKTILECHADPSSSVTLHYMLETGLTPGAAWRQKPVPQMYEGIFTAKFTLFYGDTLKYFFEIVTDNTVKKTAERTIRMNQPEGEPGSRYQLLNHLLSCHRLGRDKEAAEGLRQYLRQQQYVEEMFIPDMEENR